MYVVRAGRLEVLDEAADAVIRELGRGDTLGELALLTDSLRSASARAVRATEVIAVDRADFEELLHSSPALSLAINQSLGGQLRDTHAPVPTARPRPTTVALIALDARIPLPRLAARLGAALQAHLSVAVLSGVEVPGPAVPEEPTTLYGVTIDSIAGVSMGAVIGALYAMGHDADEIDAICFDEWVQRRPLRDFTVPRHSLIRGERFRSMLHRTFGTTLIEELPRSFMCGSAELRSGRLEIARYGPLREAVAFSICLPIIAPPQVRGRKMFVDGSLVDNLPVKAMADMGEGPIIAVDVKGTFERPKNGSAAARAGDDRPPRPPSLGETLTRLLLLGSENTSEAPGATPTW